MNKPIEVARQEFIDGMINYINSAGLPSFIIAEVIEEILPAVKSNINKEYNAAYAEYAQALQAEQQKQAEQTQKQKGEDYKEHKKKGDEK